MKRETLEMILITLSELRDDKKRSAEFARTQITPPLPVPHLHKAIREIEDAIADVEETYNVKVLKREVVSV